MNDPPEPLRITTAPADLAGLYPWLDDAAKPFALPPNLLDAMHVALEEAVMNVAMHSYAGRSGDIIVRLQIDANTAILHVEDNGPPFDPVAAPQNVAPISLADTQPGGLGLKLLRHFCKDISYARLPDGNRLTLRFPLKPELG